MWLNWAATQRQGDGVTAGRLLISVNTSIVAAGWATAGDKWYGRVVAADRQAWMQAFSKMYHRGSAASAVVWFWRTNREKRRRDKTRDGRIGCNGAASGLGMGAEMGHLWRHYVRCPAWSSKAPAGHTHTHSCIKDKHTRTHLCNIRCHCLFLCISLTRTPAHARAPTHTHTVNWGGSGSPGTGALLSLNLNLRWLGKLSTLSLHTRSSSRSH